MQSGWRERAGSSKLLDVNKNFERVDPPDVELRGWDVRQRSVGGQDSEKSDTRSSG